MRKVLYLDRRKQKEKAYEYEKWLERHKPNSNRKYTGSSQAMEPETTEKIWVSSLKRTRLVFSVFVGDGDSKALQHITSLKASDRLEFKI